VENFSKKPTKLPDRPKKAIQKSKKSPKKAFQKSKKSPKKPQFTYESIKTATIDTFSNLNTNNNLIFGLKYFLFGTSSVLRSYE